MTIEQSLEMARKLRDDGKSYAQVAAALNKAGSRTTTGKKWSIATVHNHLRKPVKMPAVKAASVKKVENDQMMKLALMALQQEWVPLEKRLECIRKLLS